MKYTFIGLLLIFGTLKKGYCQKYTDCFHLRNYQYSLAIELNDKTESGIYVFSDYGAQKSFASKKEGENYLYQSQEFDGDLGLSLFVSRMYSSLQKRFIQPDPKSQYASSYLFVGSDPVNIIDLDGNEGRPLVLYSEASGKLDFGFDRNVVPHGHYYSISDLLDNKIPANLPEWDGNVYIQAHMVPGEHGQVEAQRARYYRDLKLKGGNGSMRVENVPIDLKVGEREVASFEWVARVDANKIGERLKEFSNNARTPLNNVVFAGCQGEDAAYYAGEGFRNTASFPDFQGKSASFFGTKKGYDVFEQIDPFNKGYTNWGWIPSDIPKEDVALTDMEYGGVGFEGYIFKEADGMYSPSYYNPEDRTVEEMLYHGRMSDETSEMVSRFVREY